MEEGNMPAPPKPEPVTVEYRFVAKYEGQCTVCNLPIYVGQHAAHLSNGRNVHTDCCLDPDPQGFAP